MSDAGHKDQSRARTLSAGEMEDIIRAYLTKRFPALANLKAETPLLAGGAIDSLGILELMTFLGERFDIEIEDGDFDGETFASLASLVRFVLERKSV